MKCDACLIWQNHHAINIIKMIILLHTLYVVTRLIILKVSNLILKRYHSGKEDQELFNESIPYFELDIPNKALIDEDNGLTFQPPVYCQRYMAVSQILGSKNWKNPIKKVVDFGCAEFRLFPYLKKIDHLEEILEVDIDADVMGQCCHRVSPLAIDYVNCRGGPLHIKVLAGSVADRDQRLLDCQAVVCIELIEHLFPDTLEEVPFTVFGFIQPEVAIFTTPNADFNVLFTGLDGFRHSDHKFEWTREQFASWANNIIERYPAYTVSFHGIGSGYEGTEQYGECSQMAVFIRKPQVPWSALNPTCSAHVLQQVSDGMSFASEPSSQCYRQLMEFHYPFRVDARTDEQKILDEAEYYIRLLACENCEEYGAIWIPLPKLMPFVTKWCSSQETLRSILKASKWEVESRQGVYQVLYLSLEEEPDVEEEFLYEAQLTLDTPDVENEDWNDSSITNMSEQEHWNDDGPRDQSWDSNRVDIRNSVGLTECDLSWDNGALSVGAPQCERLRDCTWVKGDGGYRDSTQALVCGARTPPGYDVGYPPPTRGDSAEMMLEGPPPKIPAMCVYGVVAHKMSCHSDEGIKVKGSDNSDPVQDMDTTPEQDEVSGNSQSLFLNLAESDSREPAPDSGCPNSGSVQDMDTTPEQVDELEDSSSEESDSDQSEPQQRDRREERLLERFEEPVENGDVANNNRDGEGNNARGHDLDNHPMPLLGVAPRILVQRNHALEPFPHWLLRLLHLVQRPRIPDHLAGGEHGLRDEGLGEDSSDSDSDPEQLVQGDVQGGEPRQI